MGTEKSIFRTSFDGLRNVVRVKEWTEKRKKKKKKKKKKRGEKKRRTESTIYDF